MTIDNRLDRALDIFVNLLAEKDPTVDKDKLKELVAQTIEQKGCDIELSNSLSEPSTQKVLLQLVVGAQMTFTLQNHPSLEFNFNAFSKDLLSNFGISNDNVAQKEKLDKLLDASLKITLPIALSTPRNLQNMLQPLFNPRPEFNPPIEKTKKEYQKSGKAEFKIDFDDTQTQSETANYALMFGASPNGSPVLIVSQQSDGKGASLQTGSIRLGATPAGILTELEKLAEGAHPLEIRADFNKIAAQQNLTPPGLERL